MSFPYRASLVCLALSTGCHPIAATTLDTEAAATAPASDLFPTELLVLDGEGPALYTGSETNAPAFAYLSAGTVVRVVGAPIDGRVPVRVDGPLTLRGHMPMTRLGARITRRTRVSGTPTSVGPGDLVQVAGVEADGQVRVVIAPAIHGVEAGASATYEGTIPRASIEGALDTTPDPGREASIEAGLPIVLYARPGGEVIVTLPTTTAPVRVRVAREEGAFRAVRLGEGPNLIGWTDAPLGAALPPMHADVACAPRTPPMRLSGTRIARVREGARIRLGGRAFGIAERTLYAQVMERTPNGDVDVFVAADDTAAMRGLVRAEDLEE